MDPGERWQNIAPASDEPGQRRLPPDRRKRRQAVAVACVQCRNGKAKCDGTRPRCLRCKDNDVTCQYDVAEGVSRAERMKMMKRDSMSSELEELKRILTVLRLGTDNEAAAILARLRLGEPPEEVAKTLSAMASSPMATGQPPSLLARNSIDGQEHTIDRITNTTTIRHNSVASLSSPIGQSPSWPSPSSIPSTKGKQPVAKDAMSTQTFLYRPFDRDDFLLPRIEYEDGSEDDDSMDDMIDPKLLHQVSEFDIGIPSTASSSRASQSQRPSPHRQSTVRSLYPTHLHGRQPIVNTIRIHPNLDISNLFGNIPFSNNVHNVQPGNFTANVPNLQVSDLSVPTWAILPVNTWSGAGTLEHAFSGVMQQATDLVNMGVPVEQIIETHPNVAALFDEDEFKKSGILSKWAVGMVHGAYLQGNTFTCFASMYLFWSLQRWLISPSPATYEALPEWLRPTPNQLLMPHISIVDFVVWPAFRELVVQIPAMQEQMRWLMDMNLNIQCDWGSSAGEALRRNEYTGMIDLSEESREKARNLSNWSVGPSFRLCVGNADSYVKIRKEGY